MSRWLEKTPDDMNRGDERHSLCEQHLRASVNEGHVVDGVAILRPLVVLDELVRGQLFVVIRIFVPRNDRSL